MPIDPSFAGRSYPPTEPYRVGREKIREFADAVGATDPVHRDVDAARAQGHRDVIAPPTFPVLLTMAAGKVAIEDPALGLDYSRVVHGDQRFVYQRPVYAGDELTCTCTVEEVMSRAGNDFVTVRTEVSDVTGEPVATVWSKLVARAGGDA